MADSVPMPGSPESIERIRDSLLRVHFNEQQCGERLGWVGGIPDFAGRQIARPYLRNNSDSLDAVIGLFCLNEPVPIRRLVTVFSAAGVEDLDRLQLIKISGDLAEAHLNLFPCFDFFFFTDQPRSWEDNEEYRRADVNRVMWLFPESYMLAGAVDRTERAGSLLDLGTGCGIHCLLACQHTRSSIGIDINPRAVAFSRLNQAINGCSNARFLLGNLYEPVIDRVFDLIVANPPYNPSLLIQSGSDYWSGGESGEDILREIIRGLDSHLSDHGICHIITLLAHSKEGPSYLEKLSEWLVGGMSKYDVMAQVRPEPEYQRGAPPVRRAFLEERFVQFEFGLISIRKAGNEEGFYYHGPPRIARFLNDSGWLPQPVSHSAFQACKAECKIGASESRMQSPERRKTVPESNERGAKK